MGAPGGKLNFDCEL